jgi:hypothetical protein
MPTNLQWRLHVERVQPSKQEKVHACTYMGSIAFPTRSYNSTHRLLHMHAASIHGAQHTLRQLTNACKMLSSKHNIAKRTAMAIVKRPVQACAAAP